MCLAIPMKLIKKDGDIGIAELEGITREINLLLVPEAQINDFVIVHAGSAIEIYKEDEAKKILATLDSL